MDQESFRKLLDKPKGGPSSSSSSGAHVRGSLLAATAAATKGKGGGKKGKPAVDASQPAFKPRQVKKGGAKGDAYRDRATERRLGVGNDYAQVEALADEFERRHADDEDRDAVEEKRKYLGGDSAHTVLVKGLDFALLEQTRARAAAEAAATEDVSLEQAFLESAAQPRKRSRADILRELKSRRGGSGAAAAGEDEDEDKGDAKGEEGAGAVRDAALEAAKKAGKFKPIGFKPVGGGAQDKKEKVKRKKKAKAGEQEENGERKKKRKVGPAGVATDTTMAGTTARDDTTAAGPSNAEKGEQAEAGPSSAAPPPNLPVPPPEPEPIDEDFDIFADAGEYTGVDLGDDSDENDGEGERPGVSAGAGADEREDGEVQGPRRKWLATSDDEREPARAITPAARATRSLSPEHRTGGSHRPRGVEEGEMDEEGEEEEERPMRLQPLASSALPSIRDLLAMSDDVEKAEKRRARKEKNKAGGGGAPGEKETKAKVERDYQRLKAYTDKKAKS
ncbi:RED-like protein N-terminal region-domain-containing protein [Trametes maxima]|nr:RED-like protein N-terminal region-domain-containing protein [Trametes maxima]